MRLAMKSNGRPRMTLGWSKRIEVYAGHLARLALHPLRQCIGFLLRLDLKLPWLACANSYQNYSSFYNHRVATSSGWGWPNR